MGTSLDGLNAPQSLTERRHANLPSFELPPPPNLPQFNSHNLSKFPSISTLSTSQSTATSSVGHLLTPPSNSSGENASPLSSGLHSGNTPTSQGVPHYTPSYWQPNNTPSGYNNNMNLQGWNSNNSMLPPRAMFSPSLNTLVRNTTSPTTGENMPQSSYDMNPLPPFQTSMSMSAPSSAPPATPQSAHFQNPSIPVSGPASGSHTPNMYQGPPSATTPQSQGYGGYGPPSGMQQSPQSATMPGSRISPAMAQSPTGLNPPNHFNRPPYPSYSMPAMPGPIMSNIHSPNGPMSMVGSGMPGPGVYSSGYAANAQQMYGAPGQPHAAQPPNDRPFKCDQCTQSFNRNHDLKRHRRIHLAVKPFPCHHCDKSFSRKDALKRHMLVKGCGDRGAKSGSKDDSHLAAKSETMSDEGSD